MKKILLLTLLILSACAKKKEDSRVFGSVEIEGSSFKTTAAPLFELAVEGSLVEKNNELLYLIDHGANGNLSIGYESIGAGYRFSYVFQNGNTYYNMYLVGENIHMKQSTDLYNWTNEQVVLHASPGPFGQLWNPSIAIDNNGVWHMLTECSSNGDNSQAALCYSFATMQNGIIEFDTNKQAQVAQTYAGNPWIQYVPGKGILAVYGKIINNIWEIRAGILENGIMKENKDFKIYAPGIHICDPHVIETAQGSVLVLSYDQYSIYELKTTETLEQLFDRINQ